MQIASALDLLGPSFAVSNCRQQKGSKNSYDGDDNQQLNQSETDSFGVSHIDWTVALLDSHEWLVAQRRRSAMRRPALWMANETRPAHSLERKFGFIWGETPRQFRPRRTRRDRIGDRRKHRSSLG
jgi:hypothetical protein